MKLKVRRNIKYAARAIKNTLNSIQSYQPIRYSKNMLELPLASRYGCEYSQNFVIDTGDYYIECCFFNFEALFVTFENVQGDYIKTDKYRPGWGARKFRSMTVSHLCIKPRRLDWYTGESLSIALADLSLFFNRFKRVISYGESMGGFGALAYADLLSAKYVISISPQSTLDQAKVPWDKRYPRGIKEDYSGPYGDAVDNSRKANSVFLLFDQHYQLDRMHAERLRASNVHFLKLPFLGHGCSIDLVPIGATDYLLSSVLDDSFDKQIFYKILRKRRERERYYRHMQALVDSRHPAWSEIVREGARAFEAARSGKQL